MTLPTFAAPRRLRPDDLDACLDLAQDRDWGREAERWRMLLGLGEGWGIDDPDGGLAAVGLLTRFPPDTAIVGMMLVRSNRGRLGLASRMVRHLQDLAGDATVFLYATAMGEPVYARLGYVTTHRIVKHTGSAAPDTADGDGVRDMTAEDRAAVLVLDREAAGCNRSALIDGLQPLAIRQAVLPRGDGIAGYGIAWRNHQTMQIGPVIAPDDAGAIALLSALAPGHDWPVRLDLPVDRPELHAWAAGRGLEAAPPVPLMVLDGRPLPGRRERIITIAGQSTG